MAIEDIVRILHASLVEGRLTRQTVAVVGPEQMTLSEAVRRVSHVVGKSPWTFRAPILFHRILAWCFERTMKVPLVSKAQLRILSEGVVEAAPQCNELPNDLKPRIRFTEKQIRRGLPEPGSFTLADLRGCCA